MGEVMMRLSDWLITNRHQSTVANISAFLLSPTSWVNRHLYPKQIITPPLSINIKANNTTAFTPAGNPYLFHCRPTHAMATFLLLPIPNLSTLSKAHLPWRCIPNPSSKNFLPWAAYTARRLTSTSTAIWCWGCISISITSTLVLLAMRYLICWLLLLPPV